MFCKWPAILLLSFIGGIAGCNSPARKAEPALPGQTVRIVYDLHGIPHIYAKNDADLFFGQGYAMAELRPAQSEIFRLWSQGRRSEVFGEDKLRIDMFVRAMNFHGIATAQWPDYRKRHPELADMAIAYAAGVNRKYDDYRRDGWPSTMQVLIGAGYEPPNWTGPDVVAIGQLLGFGLSGGPDIELELTIAKALMGEDLFSDLFTFAPPTSAFTVPGFTETALAGRTIEKSQVGPTLPFAANPLDNMPATAIAPLKRALGELREIAGTGSNNFAMAADRMADGIALVESDTHQGLPYPGAYVLMHLISSRNGEGTQDMIGASFPGAPLVVFGHNGNVSWAPTIGYADIVDFYWEFFDPNRPSHVLRPDGAALPTEERPEYFKIRRNDGSYRYESVLVRDIPGHGPILPAEILPLPLPVHISVRWTGAELPGPVAAVHKMTQARTIDDIQAALRTLVGGTLGFTFGSTENRIAYSAWTLTPRRDASGPFRPWFVIPATYGPHWDGFLPFEQVPHWLDPARGYLWTANNDPVGNSADNDPGNDGIYHGFSYSLGYRGERLDRMLGALAARGDVQENELVVAQVDLYSIFAEQHIPYFAAAALRRPDLVTSEIQFYLDAVTTWNKIAASDSYEATIFFAWVQQFYADALLDEYGLIDEVGGGTLPILTRTMMRWLRATDPLIDEIDAGVVSFPSKSGRNFWDDRNTPDVVETRDEIILGALATAIAHLQDVFGRGANGDPAAKADDPTTWHWGRMVFLDNRHTLAEIDPTWQKYDAPRPGWGHVDTVNVGQYLAYADGKLLDRFVLNNAPSNRFIWRTDPDGIRGKFMAPWGQSEIPNDSHYDDLVDDYLQFKYRDFPYTDSEINAVMAREVLLSP